MNLLTKAAKSLTLRGAEVKIDGHKYQLGDWARSKEEANLKAKKLRSKKLVVKIRYVPRIGEYAVFYRHK